MEPPAFEDSIAAFSVTIPNHALLDERTRDWLSTLNVSGLARSQLTALALARRGETLTNVSYRRTTGVSDSRTATAHLQELRVRGLLVQEGERGQSSYRLSPSAGKIASSGVRARTQSETVLECLTTDPASVREIAERTNLTGEQVRQALARLRRAGEADLVGTPRSKKARWRLAKHPPSK
jgi:ATP-dependent DNA helicase RecG